MLAQRLYENGHITYMRTDSVNLSGDAVAAATSQIESEYGKRYVKARTYKTKSKSAQEAHEAIRPTNFASATVNVDAKEGRLYELIWKRAIASQMADAELERTTAYIDISTAEEQLQATGEVITFDGFLKVYLEGNDDDEEGTDSSKMLPPLSVGQQLELAQMLATEKFTRPAARYTEASLVKKLEEMGIGRPSTYAPTVTTVQKRGYVVKEARPGKEREYKELTLKQGKLKEETKTEITGAEKNKLFPTNIGMVVNDFLVKYFANIIDYSFTARVEEQFDEIADGRMIWNDMLDGFYGGFHQLVEHTAEKAERASTDFAHDLGPHPETGEPVTVKISAVLGLTCCTRAPLPACRRAPTQCRWRLTRLSNL